MSTLADFNGIGPLANRPAAATAHALRGTPANTKIAITWTDSETGTLYSLNQAGSAWVVIGGGGGTPLAIEDDGAQILAAASRINFAGAGVTVTDAGSGEATVTIPGGGSGGSSADTFTITSVPPATPATGRNQVAVQHDTPTRTEGGVASSVRFALTFNYGPYAANAQAAGLPEYTNNVFGLSWNLNSAYTPIDNTKGGPSIRCEHRFKVTTRNPATPGAWIDGSEFHHAMHTTGSGGLEFRPFSIYAPFATADWAYDSSTSFQSAIYAFADGHRNVHVTFAWDGTATAPKQIFLSDKVRINREGNGTAWLYQMNSQGNGLVALPFVSAQNHLQISQPIYAAIAAASLANPLGIQSLLALQGNSGFTTGARMFYLTTNAITGSGTGYEADLSASTRFEGFKVRNSHASGTSGGRIVGNGNLYLDFFRETAFKRWGMGLRSDDTFAIGQQEQGTEIADAIRINFTTLQTEFMKAPKLPSATVAGAGSASAAGVFALHGVSDLNSTTTGAVAAGGGSNKGVIVSDGTDWRIMAAW